MTPEWLNKDFFEKILNKKHHPLIIQISELKIVPTAGKGENYCSNMFKVEFKYELGSEKIEESIVIKTEPNEMIAMMGLFPKETEMYEKIIPAFESIFKVAGEDIQFAPNCLAAGTDPITYLIMEDLTIKNFRCEDRLVGLDMLHMKSILEKLAKFHAASAVYYEKNGSFSDKFCEGMFSEKGREMFMVMTETNLTHLCKAMESWPKEAQKYIEILESWKPILFDAALKATQPNQKGFNVLCHGDLWTNNFMYSHDNQNAIEKVLLVDFQICQWSSPALDLLFLLIESPLLELKVSKFDEFVEFYQNNLVINLKKLGYKKKMPTLFDLEVNILQRAALSMILMTGHMSAILLEPSEESNMENMMDSGEGGTNFKKAMFGNPRYIAHMMELLPFLEKKGVLDIAANFKKNVFK